MALPDILKVISNNFAYKSADDFWVETKQDEATLWKTILKADQQHIFSRLADGLHIIAIIILFYKIFSSRSCKGISLYSRILYLMVYLSRYLDLTTYFYSTFNTTAKIAFISSSTAIILIMLLRYKETWEKKNEVFNLHQLILPTFILALFINHEFTLTEVMWTFSIYLEAIAILPQLYMIYKTKSVDSTMIWYLTFLCLYRAVYAFHFYLRYFNEGYFENIAFNAAIVQSIIYVDFYIFLVKKKIQAKLNYNNLPEKIPIFSINVEKGYKV